MWRNGWPPRGRRLSNSRCCKSWRAGSGPSPGGGSSCGPRHSVQRSVSSQEQVPTVLAVTRRGNRLIDNNLFAVLVLSIENSWLLQVALFQNGPRTVWRSVTSVLHIIRCPRWSRPGAPQRELKSSAVLMATPSYCGRSNRLFATASVLRTRHDAFPSQSRAPHRKRTHHACFLSVCGEAWAGSFARGCVHPSLAARFRLAPMHSNAMGASCAGDKGRHSVSQHCVQIFSGAGM